MNARRKLIVALGLGALTAPLASLAQQQGKIRRIGFLAVRSRSTPSNPEPGYDAFLQGMRELGYVEGKNLVIEWRFADGKYERLPGLADELVRMKLEVIVTHATPTVEAQQLGVKVLPAHARAPEEIERGFAAMARERADAVIILDDPFFLAQRRQIAELAARNRLPSMFAYREYVQAGGLMSYGQKIDGFFRRAAAYVDKILKGAKPGELPIEQPTKIHLAINRKTAKALDISVSQEMLFRADELIE